MERQTTPPSSYKRPLPVTPTHPRIKRPHIETNIPFPISPSPLPTEADDLTSLLYSPRTRRTFTIPLIHKSPIHNRFRRFSQLSPPKYLCSICMGKHSRKFCPTLKPLCSQCNQAHEEKNCPLNIEKKKQSIPEFPPSRPKGKILTKEEKNLINRIYYELIAETAVESVSTKSAILRASKYTGISKKTIESIRREWQLTQDFAAAKTERGKYDRKLHWSRHWISDIQKIIVDLNYKGEPVTLRKILKEMKVFGRLWSRFR